MLYYRSVYEGKVRMQNFLVSTLSIINVMLAKIIVSSEIKIKFSRVSKKKCKM